MTRIGTDDKDHATTADDLAMFTNSLNAGSDFHGLPPVSWQTVPEPARQRYTPHLHAKLQNCF
jgi:hypothetical protein